MPWFIWAVIAILVLNPLVIIAKIGETRPRLTSGDAIANIIVSGLAVWAIVAGVS